ncbi:MAG: flagellar hook capping protein [Ruminococcus sp.]|nr:flagellar hook capping protein [Ruminococcus sp.]
MGIDSIGNRNYTDMLNGTSKTTSADKVYKDVKFSNEDQSQVNVQDFLNLMVTQLTNQDFMNPVDDTQYLSQLAQFSSMSAMQDLAQFSKQSFVMSYLGKDVTASVYNVGGEVETTTGKVTNVSLVGDDYKLTVNGKEFSLADIKSVSDSQTAAAVPEAQADTDILTAAALNEPSTEE